MDLECYVPGGLSVHAHTFGQLMIKEGYKRRIAPQTANREPIRIPKTAWFSADEDLYKYLPNLKISCGAEGYSIVSHRDSLTRTHHVLFCFLAKWMPLG